MKAQELEQKAIHLESIEQSLSDKDVERVAIIYRGMTITWINYAGANVSKIIAELKAAILEDAALVRAQIPEAQNQDLIEAEKAQTALIAERKAEYDRVYKEQMDSLNRQKAMQTAVADFEAAASSEVKVAAQ